MPETSPATTEWGRIGVVVGILTALQVVLLSAFALPPLHAGPHQVPLAVGGEPSSAAATREHLAARQPDAWELHTATDAEDARAMIMDREVYGALVTSSTQTRLLVATAAGPAVAERLRDLARGLESGRRTVGPVEDVRPLPGDDPTGAGLAAGALPLTLGGWIGGVAVLAAVRGARRQAAAAVAFAALGGLSLTALLQFAFGSLDGDYWATAGAAFLGISATAWAILGLRTALGNAGLACGAVVLIVLGNPLSGLSSAPELLPAGWGTLGQMPPPGATGSLLRSVAYFDGAGGFRPALVLVCWLAGGITLYAAGLRRTPRRPAEPVGDPRPSRAQPQEAPS